MGSWRAGCVETRTSGLEGGPRKRTGRKAGTLWYYRELVKVFREVGPHLMAKELGRVVTQLERLAARRPAQRRSPPRQGRRAG